jgi:hypothetical protein
VLYAGAQPREVERIVEPHLAERDEREGERGAERRRRRQSGALGEIGVDPQPCAGQVQALGAQLGDHPAHERAPVPVARVRRVVGGEDVVLSETGGVGEHAPVERRLGADGDAALDGERQAEPVVVVGVLPDEVDAARAVRGDLHGRDANVPAPMSAATP